VEKYIYMRAGRVGFSFIRKTASMRSSATGALVAAGSLQPAGLVGTLRRSEDPSTA
jgi:hypothetical protein